MDNNDILLEEVRILQNEVKDVLKQINDVNIQCAKKCNSGITAKEWTIISGIITVICTSAITIAQTLGG